MLIAHRIPCSLAFPSKKSIIILTRLLQTHTYTHTHKRERDYHTFWKLVLPTVNLNENSFILVLLGVSFRRQTYNIWQPKFSLEGGSPHLSIITFCVLSSVTTARYCWVIMCLMRYSSPYCSWLPVKSSYMLWGWIVSILLTSLPLRGYLTSSSCQKESPELGWAIWMPCKVWCDMATTLDSAIKRMLMRDTEQVKGSC